MYPDYSYIIIIMLKKMNVFGDQTYDENANVSKEVKSHEIHHKLNIQ